MKYRYSIYLSNKIELPSVVRLKEAFIDIGDFVSEQQRISDQSQGLSRTYYSICAQKGYDGHPQTGQCRGVTFETQNIGSWHGKSDIFVQWIDQEEYQVNGTILISVTTDFSWSLEKSNYEMIVQRLRRLGYEDKTSVSSFKDQLQNFKNADLSG